jgi:hypothetical protein
MLFIAVSFKKSGNDTHSKRSHRQIGTSAFSIFGGKKKFMKKCHFLASPSAFICSRKYYSLLFHLKNQVMAPTQSIPTDRLELGAFPFLVVEKNSFSCFSVCLYLYP